MNEKFSIPHEAASCPMTDCYNSSSEINVSLLSGWLISFKKNLRGLRFRGLSFRDLSFWGMSFQSGSELECLNDSFT